MSNKNAGTEDEVGRLHKLITLCHNLKTGAMLKLARDLEEAGADAEDVGIVINTRDLSAAQKWVEYNGVGCLTADESEESELSKRLKDIKRTQTKASKIVSITDVREEAMGG